MVHGGLLATLMDEGMAKCCFAALPNKIGLTANLTMNYRAPAPAGSFVVLKAAVKKAEGRKVWVEARIEALGEGVEPGKLLVEAEGLFVEPKFAKVSFPPPTLLRGRMSCRQKSNCEITDLRIKAMPKLLRADV